MDAERRISKNRALLDLLLFQALFACEAELASRSDTGLRKQTGEGEAFTGGGMLFPPINGVCPVFCPRVIP